MSFYVYRLLNEARDVLYVGKTTNLSDRISTHISGRGHLPKEVSNSIRYVEVKKYKTKLDMDIHELYYINKLRPKYNKKDVQTEEMSTTLDDGMSWELYKEVGGKGAELEDKVKQLAELEDKIKQLKDTVQALKKELQEKDNVIKYFLAKTDSIKPTKRRMNSRLSFYEAIERLNRDSNLFYKTEVACEGLIVREYIIYKKEGDGIHFVENVEGIKSNNSYSNITFNDVGHWTIMEAMQFKEMEPMEGMEIVENVNSLQLRNFHI